MNITADNYEAYLLDYLDGKLGSNEAEQLHAFVTAQGLDWGELTEALPQLEAPEMEFEGKERLKKKGTVVPLYAKIASAAAATGLLLTIGLWPEKSLPKVEPIAELKPIQSHLTIAEAPIQMVPKRTTPFAESYSDRKEAKSMPIRTEAEAIATLPPMKAQEIVAYEEDGFALASDIELLRYRLESEATMARLALESTIEEEMPTSLIGRGIYRMTEGRHSSIMGLINAGLHLAKKEIVKATNDMAVAAYYQVDEHREEARERWKEKHEE